jgi:hypothetical protein
MQNNNKKINIFFVSFFVLGLFLIVGSSSLKISSDDFSKTNLANVTNRNYVPLTPLPGLNQENNKDLKLGEYLQIIFNWGISLSVILAILMIIFGGFEYMTIDSVYGKENGKEKVKGAVAGLILALSAWLILRTINPKIVEQGISVEKVEYLS